jgi:hypothetical protein
VSSHEDDVRSIKETSISGDLARSLSQLGQLSYPKVLAYRGQILNAGRTSTGRSDVAWTVSIAEMDVEVFEVVNNEIE